MSEGKLWTPDFNFIALVNLFLALIFYLSMIVISQFATEQFQATPGEAEAAVGMFVIGLLVACFFTGNLLGRVGLARVLYTGVGLSISASTLYFTAASLPLLRASASSMERRSSSRARRRRRSWRTSSPSTARASRRPRSSG